MSRHKPYPSDPSLRDSRVGDSPARPVTAPTAAPPGPMAPNSVRAREEGLGVKPAVVGDNLEALAELAAANDETRPDDGSGKDVHPDESAEAEAERQKREKRNARRRELRAAKKAAEAKKAPAKKKGAKK